MREARAYNYSIYVMIGVPYLVFGGLAVYFYRCCKAADRRNAALLAGLNSPLPESPVPT
jgi:hypothetical protein